MTDSSGPQHAGGDVSPLVKQATELLLPLRSMVVTLRCVKEAQFPILHNIAIYAFLKTLADHPQDWSKRLSIESPESGQIHYPPSYCYRFKLIAFAGSEHIVKRIIKKLQQLPDRNGSTALQRNWQLEVLHDAITGSPITQYEQLQSYTATDLQNEAVRWQHNTDLKITFASPAQWYLEKSRRNKKLPKIEQMCRDQSDLNGEVLFNHLQNTLLNITRPFVQLQRQAAPETTISDAHIFWLDSSYKGDKKRPVPIGGLCGWLALELSTTLTVDWWQLLLLGQHHGIGNGTAFGWGRYQLSAALNAPGPVVCAAQSLLQLVREEDNLVKAWAHVTSGTDRAIALEQFESPDLPIEQGDSPAGEWVWEIDTNEVDAFNDNEPEFSVPVTAMQQKLQQLVEGEYPVPQLNGYLIAKPAGGYRALAVPPFADRVLQRALTQILTPALDQLMERRSYGFRPGHSRMGARDDIEAAWREGYRWVFESDVKDFFDSVKHARLRDRLIALYPQDPVVDAIMAWLAAPVKFNGEVIERKNGLPQGSPLSPVLANLMLDDFDSDMRNAGYRMVRFADDFVVLCKSREQASEAAEAVKRSLAEHGFELNADKTAITGMEQGFRYLGYLFVGELALDVGSKKIDLQSANKEKLPGSWLHSVEHREPALLQDHTALEKLWLKYTGDGQQVSIGDRETGGEFVALTGAPAVVSTRNRRLQIVRKDRILRTVPWRQVQTVVLFGNHQVTTQAAHAAMQHGVCIHMANGYGSYRGALVPGKPDLGHRLWLAQTARFNDPKVRLHCAKQVITSRLRHCRETIRQKSATELLNTFDSALTSVQKADNLASLRGIEGSVARQYFAAIAELLSDKMEFTGRNRRPPRDPFNCLLSLGYQMIYGYCDSITRATGLCPWEGFFHRSEGAHSALISDLIEPFRHIVERTAITVVNRKQIKPEHFQYSAAGACIMEDNARRIWLGILVDRLQISATARGESQSYKLTEQMHRQALSLRRFITDAEPFTCWRML